MSPFSLSDRRNDSSRLHLSPMHRAISDPILSDLSLLLHTFVVTASFVHVILAFSVWLSRNRRHFLL